VLGGDGFVAELNPRGTPLVFSSCIGGSSDDRVGGIAVDSSGNIWVSGQTLSPNFPVTSGSPAFAGDNGGRSGDFKTGDAFLVEINPARAIAFGTFLGGASSDWAAGISIEGPGGGVIVGATNSSNFATTAGAFQT
jgi:hypothetical protein